jgi:hypothetical protein
VTGAPPDWHPDPYGRATLRYWDGTGWTEHVTRGGHPGRDPLPTPDTRVLDETLLVVEYDSPETGPGWRVWDRGQRQVGVVTGSAGLQMGPMRYALLDPAGLPLLVVREGGLASPGLHVEDPFGRPLGHVSGFGTSQLTRYELSTGRVPVGRASATMTPRSIDVEVTDGVGRRVATMGKATEPLSTFRHRSWFTLERDPTLVDPLRLLVVALPLSVHLDLTRRSIGNERGSWNPL